MPYKHTIYTFLLLLFCMRSTAQELRLFNVMIYESVSGERRSFVSLSDEYLLSEHPDSLATPDFTDVQREWESQFEIIEIDEAGRKQMLSRTKISAKDRMFIYSYSKDKLITIPVAGLKAIACLNIYGADWPYTQYDYMIGFEIDQALLKELEPYYENTLVYIGKKNPFIQGEMTNIRWESISSENFPTVKPMEYDTSFAGLVRAADCFLFETSTHRFFLRNYVGLDEDYPSLKRLLVFDRKSNKLLKEKIYYSGESESLAEPEYQWTGKLFKNHAPVVFGFQWISFGCPYISFIGSTEEDVYIRCDNRH